ncbi:hypothetical protein B9Z55_003634 [Caenorhabditis nigoni]|uniref:C-type lectin domain-containing protein n=1 Tax=Caenorhabditis nigoni TaxID=1611254 RepID=A0A2G5VRQ2_9PELO|nr:hypothetical protein B9Z55_003634 [Caenorhabditis nigoni]
MRFLLFLSWITVVFGIFIEDDGGYGGRGESYSSSSSSESHEGHGHHHRPRPSRPRPPHRPPSRPRSCEDGWMTFDRPQGQWCVKVFYGMMMQSSAEAMCKAQGATLTGFQTAGERVRVADAARDVSNANGGGLSEIWIGATLKPSCPRRGSCAPLDTFQWTDGHTTGTAGFYYPGNEPNYFRGTQSCLIMHQSVVAGQNARYNYPHASLDDDNCLVANWVRMYACGKVPS